MTKRPTRPLNTRAPRAAVATLLGAFASLAAVVPSHAGGGTSTMRVQGIRVTESDSDTAVVIAASARPTFTTFKLDRPARIVVDISGARLGDLDVPFDAGTYAVGSVSASATEDDSGVRTRVVLTLRQPSDCRFEAHGNDIVVRVVPHVRPIPIPTPARVASDDASKLAAERAKASAETTAARLAVDKANAAAETTAARLAVDKANAAAATTAAKVAMERAKTSAEAAAARLAMEKARASVEATAAQLTAERANASAEAAAARLASDRARAAAEAEAGKLAVERARTEEARRQADAARLTAETEARKLAVERARTEEARRQAEAARRAADVSAQNLALDQARHAADQARTEQARRETEKAARTLAAERADLNAQRARATAAAQAGAADQARTEQTRRETEKAARTLAAERADLDAQRARAAAAAQAAQGQAESVRRELDAARAELQLRREALSRSEAELRRAQQQASEVRRRTDQAERQAEAARMSEEERGNAVRVAAAQVEARRRMVETKVVNQEAQRQRLVQAERVVSERDARLKAAAAQLIEREKAAADATAHKLALEKAGASDEQRARAAREAAQAAEQRVVAQAAADRSRRELEEAVGARKQEDVRRRQIEAERLAEERRLKDAVAARTAEEARRQAAEDGRRKEEARLAEASASRARAESERAKLQVDRDVLLVELKRLKDRASAAPAKAPAPKVAVPHPVLASASVAPAPAPAPLVPPARSANAPASEPASPAVVPAPRVAAAAPATPARSVTLRVPSRVQRIDFVDEPSRSSVIIDLDEPSLFAVQSSGGRRVTLRLLHAELPRGLARSLDATEYLGPVRVISTYRDPESPRGVRVDVDLAEDVPNKVRQDGARLYWDFQKTALSQRATAPAHAYARSLSPRLTFVPARQVAGFRAVFPLPLVVAQEGGSTAGAAAPAGNNFRPGGTFRKRYTGRRVDLDFKSADIHNILRLLADVGQVNIVTADDVKGEVTIKMRDVPWDQALDVVLRGKQLGSVREGNLIRVAPLMVLEKELEQEIARQRQLQDVLPTETRLIAVSYADAKSLQDRAKDLLSSRGKISVDDRTNNLIVSDVAKNLALIEELVRNLDTQTSQVVIEARIVEARSTFVRQLGVQWGGTGFADVDHGNPTGLAFPYNIGVGGGATDGSTPVAGLVPNPRNGLTAANPNFAVNLPVASGTGAGGALGLTLGSVAGAFNLNLRLSALESSGQVRILSSPRITTMDNIEASIEQGVAVPISVVSAAGVSTVFVDAKLNLTVRPHVTNEGTVMMSINVTRNEPDFVNTGARGDPTILKKEAKTSMLIRDGDTAVIGGIYTRNSGLSYAKVPFFADIPVLGVMFRNRRENDDRTEFLVFITPRIANRARPLGQ